jgi:hypothetical protein
MVDAMKPGSVVVDIAADGGGNCEATRPGEAYVTDKGVKILGYRNWPGRISVAASALYSKNLLTFLTTFWDKAAGAPRLPEDDAIIKGVMLTRGGAVVHANFAAPAPASPAPVPEPEVAGAALPESRADASPAPVPPDEAGLAEPAPVAVEHEAAAPAGPDHDMAPPELQAAEAAPAPAVADDTDDAGGIELPATPITASAPQPEPEDAGLTPESGAGAAAASDPPRGGGKKKGPRPNRPTGGKAPRAGES